MTIGFTFGKRTQQKAQWLLSLSEYLDGCPVMSPMIQKEFLISHNLCFPENRQYLEDLHFRTELLVRGARWICIACPLYRYVLRKTSLSHNRGNLNQQKAQSLRALAIAALERGFVREATRMNMLARKADMVASTWEFVGFVRLRNFKGAAQVVWSKPNVLLVLFVTIARWVKLQIHYKSRGLCKDMEVLP